VLCARSAWISAAYILAVPYSDSPGPNRIPEYATMGLSKSNRILILLAIDTLFFLLELIVGML
jgi:hypothetical protein